MTIKDIARLCGVSVSTVSRVLNDRPDVSPAVREAVLEAVRASNYVPNNSARALVKTSSDAIGLVVRGVSNPFYSDIIKAIGREVDAAGFTMVMQQIAANEDEIVRGALMEREKLSGEEFRRLMRGGTLPPLDDDFPRAEREKAVEEQRAPQSAPAHTPGTPPRAAGAQPAADAPQPRAPQTDDAPKTE